MENLDSSSIFNIILLLSFSVSSKELLLVGNFPNSQSGWNLLMSCPTSSFRYNTTLCACPPGQIPNLTANTCVFFNPGSPIIADTGIDYYAVTFPETIFSLDSIKKFTKSQAVFLEATLVLVVSWLVFCFFLRFMKLSDGRNIWFKIRWWISRLDICFATRHWLDDQKVVVKRKTELGGAFSIASWILFIGLFGALLYQILSSRSIEVRNVRAVNSPELTSFMNSMEFNITTISTMNCANVRDLGTLMIGSPGFFEQKVVSLSDFASYSCYNTSEGPTISLRCSKCHLIQDDMYISWQFIDIPDSPASAVGFQFNLTSRSNTDKKHVSFVSGTVKNISTLNDQPVTYRGKNANILKFNIFPQIYRNLHDLKLMQPLFHQFVPGSFFSETSQLQSSLENPNDGLLNTTLYVNLLSSYVVEIDKQTIMGPVSFLADLGGLYCISIGIFFYLLVQFEYRIKKLRNEDSTIRKIRSRRRAQDRWDKLRKYVMYTWGCNKLDVNYNNTKKEPDCSSFMFQSIRRNVSLRKTRQHSVDSLNFNMTINQPSQQTSLPQNTDTQDVKSLTSGIKPNHDSRAAEDIVKSARELQVLGSTSHGEHMPAMGNSLRPGTLSFMDNSNIPPPPNLEIKSDSQTEMSDILKNMKSLNEYNVVLREKLLATQSLLHSLSVKLPLSP